MEWSSKTWSGVIKHGQIKRGVMKQVLPLHVLSLHVLSLHVLPLHVLSLHVLSLHSIPYFIVCPFYYGVDHHILWLHVLLFPSSTKWCWADRPFIPELRFFFSLLVILFFTFFLPSVTDSKSRHAFDARQKRDDLSPSSPARQTHNSANHKGIRSVDKLLNSCTLLDLQRFLKTRELWSSKVN